ncbi:MAG TPA: class I SAM-dependent methyltransferase [Blastocatellia bacterium]|nr:class I SAM-dependent methyltransferase [Blastocatellia bacterium]
MSGSHSGRRRESFDEVAELYDKARPGYPPRLVDDILELSGLDKGCRVLEIGPGSGQLTIPLAERGLSLVAVELGANLAGVARRKLARFQEAEVVVADFDEWATPSEMFDLVAVATAFHWLNPTTRVRKCADALRSGGTLAIVETHWGVSYDVDRFSIESQTCHARWDPFHDPAFRLPRIEDLPQENEELATSAFFEPIAHRRYLCAREYGASQYCDLLETYSNIRAFEPETRRKFLACIANLIESRFDGKIVRHDTYDLWLARRSRHKQ